MEGIERGKPRRACILPVAFLVLLGSCSSAPAASAAAGPDKRPRVDFVELLRLSEAYWSMRYAPVEETQRVWGQTNDELAVVDIEKTSNRYMIGTVDGVKRQDIFIRGTANRQNAIADIEVAKRRSAKLGIDLHRGFEDMAAAGAAAFASLPLIRVVNEGDPVPLLPPRTLISPADPYVHIGDAVVLLDGPYYCMLGEQSRNEPLAEDFWRSLKTNSLRGDVREHFIAAYIERIRPKVAGAVEVPPSDRTRHIGAQTSGM